MAVQLQVAYSKTIVGAGVIAGGPYDCAARNIARAPTCMGQVPFVAPDPAPMVAAARRFASAGQIDALGHLAGRRIYLFSGTEDVIVRQKAVDAAAAFFRLAGVPADRLSYVHDIAAGHAFLTADQGNHCAANKAPYISHCQVDGKAYDQAGALLAHIYGPLKPAAAAATAASLIAFDQRAYAAASTGMAAAAYVYVPASCRDPRARCRIHVAIHGCAQSAESVGTQFVTATGYNRWAESNAIVVLYPQVNKSTRPFNPLGCWDWWGYTGPDYAWKSAPQMKAIDAMVRRLAE